MKYTHNAFLRAEEELKKRRQDAEDDLAAREDYIYSKLPEVRDMRESLKTSYLELMKIIAGHDPEAAASAAAVREKNLATQERIAILIEDLTGDRKYFVGQQVRTETFYMLFKTVSSNGSSLTYRVQPSIVQDMRNENSYVYKLANVKNLTAEKTGNLVVIHYVGSDVTTDLLLDIDK